MRGCPHGVPVPDSERRTIVVTEPLPIRESVDHTPGRAQSWKNVDAEIRAWVVAATDNLVGTIDGPRVVGVYLHGSLTRGSYYRPNSDVDVLVVVDAPFNGEQRRRAAKALLAAFDARPTVGGLEASIVRDEVVRIVTDEPPHELHFSEKWADEVRAGGSGPSGTDVDLIAICAACRASGIPLAGRPPAEVFGAVPFERFWHSIRDDFDWIVAGGIVESPVYSVLNLCRTLRVHAAQAVIVDSKEAGARWAMSRVPPEHRETVDHALACYRSGAADRSAPPADARPSLGDGAAASVRRLGWGCRRG